MSTQRAYQEELNPFEIAKQQFTRAADYLDLDASMRHVLQSAKRQLIVSIPVKMEVRRPDQAGRGVPRDLAAAAPPAGPRGVPR